MSLESVEEETIETSETIVPDGTLELIEYEPCAASLEIQEPEVQLDHNYTKNVQSNSSVRPRIYNCEHCDLKFGCMKVLRLHKKNVHNIPSGPIISRKKCCLCNITFETEDYLSHFELHHNIKLLTEKLYFHTLAEFTSWKEMIEKETKSKFVKKFGSRANRDSVVHSFSCHRSGFFRSGSKGLRNLKTQGSHKINGFCPASIKVYESKRSKRCTVWFLKTHVGHETEIGHLNLSSSDRELLAQKIAARIPFDKILDEIRDSIGNSELERLHLVTKKDLINIARSYNLGSDPKPEKDESSFEVWLNEVQFGENKCILFYKDEGNTCDQFPELDASDFILVMMNDAQCEILKQFSSEWICIDRTDDLHSSGLELFTLLVVDDLQQGFPCSFLMSNRGDEVVMKTFFSVIKEKVGVLTPRFFMSDIEDWFSSAWLQVMNAPVTCLFNSWHVNRAWKKELKNVHSKELDVHKMLKDLMVEPDKSAFEAAIVKVVKCLQQDPNTAEFSTYFIQKFVLHSKSWAHCYHGGNRLSINICLEHIHKALKCIYLQRKHAKSIDTAVNGLMKYLKNKLIERIIIKNKGKVNKKQKNLRERHTASLSFEGTVVETEEGWIVASAEGSELVQENETNCSCKLMCLECHSCLHKYTCSCIDACIKWNMCKHIHFICMYRARNESCMSLQNNYPVETIKPEQ